MKKLIYIGLRTKTGKLLIKEFENLGYIVIIPDLTTVSYFSTNGKVHIDSESGYISDVSVMMIRSTKNIDIEKLYLLASSLEKNGCLVIDGSERVKRFVSSKSASSIERTGMSGGIPTFIPASKGDYMPLAYPVIVKPTNGKYCRGVTVCVTERSYLDSVKDMNDGIIVQKYIPFKYENRVLVLNVKGRAPKLIYIASKKNVARRGTKRKATFVPDSIRRSLEIFIMFHYINKKDGLIGYDIGTDDSGNHFIIEANYSPRFDRATVKLNVNIAEIVVKAIDDYATKTI